MWYHEWALEPLPQALVAGTPRGEWMGCAPRRVLCARGDSISAGGSLNVERRAAL
jgi:hypothetical protein